MGIPVPEIKMQIHQRQIQFAIKPDDLEKFLQEAQSDLHEDEKSACQ